MLTAEIAKLTEQLQQHAGVTEVSVRSSRR